MKYSFRVVIGKFIICSSILLLCFIGMILAAIITKLTFVALAWFQSGILEVLRSDIDYAAHLVGVGGGPYKVFVGFCYIFLGQRALVENNYLSVSEKTELEIAKQTLKNSKDPAEREKVQQKYDALLEKDIASDKEVIAACSNGNAGSSACASARLKVIASKEGYEDGPYKRL